MLRGENLESSNQKTHGALDAETRELGNFGCSKGELARGFGYYVAEAEPYEELRKLSGMRNSRS